MSGMHTAIQVKSEEKQVARTPFIWEGDIKSIYKGTGLKKSVFCLNPLYTHNETDKYQDHSLLQEASLHS